MDKTYTVPDLASWLHMKSLSKQIASQAADLYHDSAPNPRKREQHTTTRIQKEKTTTVYLNTNKEQRRDGPSLLPYCPHYDTRDHFHRVCTQFKAFSTARTMLVVCPCSCTGFLHPQKTLQHLQGTASDSPTSCCTAAQSEHSHNPSSI